MINFLQKSELPSIRILFYVHFAICSVGLLVLISHVSGWIGEVVFRPINIFISYNKWADLDGDPSKPGDLIQYAFSVVSLLFYYVLITLYINKFSDQTTTILRRLPSRRPLLILYFGLLVILNFVSLRIDKPFIEIFYSIWFLIFFLPTFPVVSIWLDSAEKKVKMYYGVIFVLLFTSILYAFYPFITGSLPVSNDYMDIPEKTTLSTGTVDNTEYINAHKIGGLIKHDPRKIGGGQTYEEKVWSDCVVAPIEDGAVEGNISHLEWFECNDEHGAKIAPQSDKTRSIIPEKNKSEAKKSYSLEEIEFVRKNRRELVDQALAGHYFHHQNTMLGTINEYDLGKPRDQTVYLYGWMSTIFIANAMKMLGGITFKSYSQVLYSAYPIYYFLLIVAAGIIFRKVSYALLIGIIAAASLYMLGFENIRFAPGFDPYRHFFDIFSLVCFYWYLFASRKNIVFLALGLSFSIVGILWSKEFGVVLFCSMLATIIIRNLIDKRNAKTEISILILAVIGAVVASTLIKTGENPTLLYVLLGVATPSIPKILMYTLLLVFGGVYLLLINSNKNNDKWSYLTLFWFFYAQGLLIYFVWNPALNHLYSLGAVLGILFALILKQIGNNYSWRAALENKLLLAINIILALCLFSPSFANYYRDQQDYRNIFTHHELHQWTFPRAEFVSTMEPAVFENAVQLINKYSESNSIYILSKYDNILPFLANKYSAMPFQEMGLSLVTKKEMDTSISLIRHNLPTFLFVDSDITQRYAGEVYKKNDPATKFLTAPVFDATRGRAMMLANFGRVFTGIKELYEPAEIGQLITVYKLKNANKNNAN